MGKRRAYLPRDLLPSLSSKWRPRSWPIRLYTMSLQRVSGRNSVRALSSAKSRSRTEESLCRRRDGHQPRNLDRSSDSFLEQVSSARFQTGKVQYPCYQRCVFNGPNPWLCCGSASCVGCSLRSRRKSILETRRPKDVPQALGGHPVRTLRFPPTNSRETRVRISSEPLLTCTF